ncbi:hypothetical protein EV424DRAFT_1536128 [Suillus variegatus]|nr:hypothetical protein EV424DRAFT_1536128 [Suillus variegatus]
MFNSTSGNKKSAWQLLEERQAKEEEEECKCKEAEEEQKHMEEQKRKDIEETWKRLAEQEQEHLAKARADNASERDILSSNPLGPTYISLIEDYLSSSHITILPHYPFLFYNASKEKCVSRNPPVKAPAGKGKGKKYAHPEGTPSPKAKGKRCQQSPEDIDNDVEIISSPWTAWVATANNIVAELAQTNGLMERGIAAAEGSRAAMDQVSETMLRFMEEQREFQNLFLEGLRNRFRMNVENSLEEEVAGEAEKEAGGSGGDMEMDS